MRWRVRDILEPIAEQWRGTGLDLSCPAGRNEAIKAYNRINECLMNHKDWPGTEATVSFAVNDGCITLPERFGAITGILVDGFPRPINSMGWEFVDGGEWERGLGSPDGALQHLGSYFPTVRELCGEMPVGAVSDREEDPGARFVVTGIDSLNRQVRYSLPIKHAGMNDQREVNAPWITAGAMRSIEAISKPVTRGYVQVFGYTGESGMHWLSRMGPGEQSPALTRYRLAGVGGRGAPVCMRARVSLRFTMLFDEEDISLIQHREAYRLMAQSLSYFDDGEVGNGSAYQNRALKMLSDATGKQGRGQRFAMNVHPRSGFGRKNYTARYG
jgi:hypothetical protein